MANPKYNPISVNSNLINKFYCEILLRFLYITRRLKKTLLEYSKIEIFRIEESKRSQQAHALLAPHMVHFDSCPNAVKN